MRPFNDIKEEINSAVSVADTNSMRRLAQEIRDHDTPLAEVVALNTLGNADNMTSNYSSALEHFDQAVALLIKQGDRAYLATTLGNMSFAYHNIGNFPAALERLRQALAIHEECGHQSGVAIMNSNMGTIYQSIGNYPSALEHKRKALTIHEELGNRHGAAICTGGIAGVFMSTGEYNSALEHFARALAEHIALGDRASVAASTGNTGAVYAAMGDSDLALEYYRKAWTLHEELGDRAAVAGVMGNMIDALILADRHDEADVLLNQQAKVDLQIPTTRARHQAYRSRVAEHREDLDSAIEFLLKALGIATEFGLRAETANFHENLRDLAKKRNDFEGYILHNDEYQRINEEVRGREATQKMAIMEADKMMESERRERDKERAILYSTLPGHVADRLIRGEDVSGDHFDHASVMFLDVVGFTTNSHDLEPRVVTELLDDLFNAFDELCEKHNVTKIKTIGDAYLAVAFPHEDQSTEQNIGFVALGILQLQFVWPDKSPLQFRIGLHAGPVVAGVIGKQRLQYDVWGDTVNVASRMESSGEAGRIHASESFFRSLTSFRDDGVQRHPDGGEADEGPTYTLTERGTIEVKGKGTMQTYWLESTA